MSNKYVIHLWPVLVKEKERHEVINHRTALTIAFKHAHNSRSTHNYFTYLVIILEYLLASVVSYLIRADIHFALRPS